MAPAAAATPTPCPVHGGASLHRPLFLPFAAKVTAALPSADDDDDDDDKAAGGFRNVSQAARAARGGNECSTLRSSAVNWKLSRTLWYDA